MNIVAPEHTAFCRKDRLEVAVRSLRSPTDHGRRENQDNYLVVDGQGRGRFLREQQEAQVQLADWPSGHWRIAVLDGMGGHSHGREAAQRAVEGLLDVPPTVDLNELCRALNALHGTLYLEFQSAGLETGCTLILIEIPADGPALLFHVGDSRVYAINQEHVECLTVDHVPATHLALLGLVDNVQWLQQVHVRPNSQISQAFILGSTLGVPTLQVDTIGAELFELHDGNLPLFLRGLGDRRLLTLESGWVYLLASDGLWHLLKPQAFIRRWPSLLGSSQHSLDYLVDRLLDELADFIRQQRSQPDDNCTVVLLRKSAPIELPPGGP
ncbi:MAG: protein phosphatase 2C domain-containing protein [Candidatus Competibacteraceae bacterium]|nr:protein phosphatase 2C domain-containing protein [Candidatus Competibacteraceae bacterium]MBK7982381.1 protein phosphatase 2C domain-containing protein [Candidatus Competibacteraceae bacterium]MBK8899067.1 protein phosphatase 2C domain-containing protein [Candidatus Competibacteraceae bacterium]MBK8963109.1 protein phosphatase 2C domain-containing protein [Candidatus Competibacteraceae bacterium]MBK9952072.1 protein phosphatase 2C domain-containing protein [Candidatus Competibacteraceae bact